MDFADQKEEGRREVKEVTATDIEKTMTLINEKIWGKCQERGDSAREIYFLSMALKEINQLEPREM